MISRVLGTVEHDGGATFACPNCTAPLDTADALIREQIPDGLRFRGLPCHYCGKSFTVELTEGQSC